MTPTNEFRVLVRRELWNDMEREVGRSLQQKWVDDTIVMTTNPPKLKEEWRDIPLVEETV